MNATHETDSLVEMVSQVRAVDTRSESTHHEHEDREEEAGERQEKLKERSGREKRRSQSNSRWQQKKAARMKRPKRGTEKLGFAVNSV